MVFDTFSVTMHVYAMNHPVPHSANGLLEQRSLRGLSDQRGMTILELMITLAVIGLVMIIGYNAVRFVAGSALSEGATEVGQILRASYSMATTTGKHHRVVFDLEKQTFRIEMCEGNIRLRLGDEEEIPEEDEQKTAEEIQQTLRDSSIPAEVAKATSPEEAAQMAAALSGTRIGTATCKPPQTPTGDRDGRGAQRALDTEGGIKIGRMFVQHLEGEQSNGIVHLNFFPLGMGEKALIEVNDEDGDAITILVHAFTGRIEFRDGRVDEDEFMMRRADGERVNERK